MNVLFHTTAAVVIVSVVGITENKNQYFSNKKIKNGIIAFVLGILSHGILDVIPHCYPINSKIDAVVSLAIMIGLLFLSNNGNRIIVALALVGSVFPDLIDLTPQITEKYIGVNLPNFGKIFPWHWHEFSGSVYNENCFYSSVYHTLFLVLSGFICWLRRDVLFAVFSNK